MYDLTSQRTDGSTPDTFNLLLVISMLPEKIAQVQRHWNDVITWESILDDESETTTEARHKQVERTRAGRIANLPSLIRKNIFNLPGFGYHVKTQKVVVIDQLKLNWRTIKIGMQNGLNCSVCFARLRHQ